MFYKIILMIQTKLFLDLYFNKIVFYAYEILKNLNYNRYL